MGAPAGAPFGRISSQAQVRQHQLHQMVRLRVLQQCRRHVQAPPQRRAAAR
jgi:hypothetical protein